jgi:hypothetical protein
MKDGKASAAACCRVGPDRLAGHGSGTRCFHRWNWLRLPAGVSMRKAILPNTAQVRSGLPAGAKGIRTPGPTVNGADPEGRPTRPCPAHHHIDLPAAAFGTDQPLAPIRHGLFAAVPSSHLGGIGLDLMLAFLAPNDQPHAGSRCATQRHRRAGSDFISDRRHPLYVFAGIDVRASSVRCSASIQ